MTSLFVAVALLLAPAPRCARADLTPEDRIEVLDIKDKANAIALEALQIYNDASASEDTKTRAQRIVTRANNIVVRCERLLGR